MSRIRGKDTKPELVIRKELHKRGFRYRLYRADLPGKPDIVLPKYNAVIEINGCFWHGHNCRLFKWPSTRADFWKEKISKNTIRDRKNIRELHLKGWRVLVIWECAIKGKNKIDHDLLFEKVTDWIANLRISDELSGTNSEE